MSENDPIPTPSKQTSSIPLKKETVRVTLKAADAPPASPSSAIPVAPAVRPPTPTAPPVASAPVAPTVGGPPRPAATIPLKTAGAPSIPRPAPTIRLSPAPGAPTTPGTAPAARPALPGATAGGATVSLPKATVQLQPPGAPTGALPPQNFTVSSDEEEEVQDSPLVGILSIVGFLAALVVLYFQLSTANSWLNGEWGQLF